eukprot:CAMPEP_0202901194 /NCGR_PEP_ID=MMETSP1392-20130828/13871_1 /ASSEMBLY_ACC=CAM_ASM_000868 /TAXON_ID=225041 /ORGANISM="Chlamydomonas chlamydogama, Strain SAG 11-48b" /LENGTH=294 /DNA_ID=CAMNT_0049587715 /DNA_START=242 /DNA_END=1126 /DNA_ORIENTATION=+
MSLVFHCEVDTADAKAPPTFDNCTETASVKERIQFYATPDSVFASKLLMDVQLLKRHMLQSEGEVNTVHLANQLSDAGYTVSVRNALGGGSSCFRNLRHEFLLVKDCDHDAVEHIVDLRFNEHFQIPHPTRQYADILSLVPEEFVGPSSKLLPVVQILCSEMAASFEVKGLTLPPWRRTQSMLSKWMSTKVRDVSFSRSDSNAVSVISSPPQGQSPVGASPPPMLCPEAAAVKAPLSLLSVKLVTDSSCIGKEAPLPGMTTAAPSMTKQPGHHGMPTIHTIKFGFSSPPQQQRH